MSDVRDLTLDCSGEQGPRRDEPSLHATKGRFWLSVIISDVTSRGARLSGNELPPQESQILLQADELKVAGRVAWSVGTECGIEFNEAIDAALLARCRRRGLHGRIAVECSP